MRPETPKEFFKSTGRRGSFRAGHYPKVSMAEIEYWYPCSVFKSLLDRANWVNELRISAMAKRLTRLRDKAFRIAVQSILNG